MRSLRALAALCLFVLAAPAADAAAAEPASPAHAFVDSIGVNVHMTYLDTAYADRELLVDKLSAAGIRHVRDGLSWDTDYAYATFNRLADRGIGTTFIMGEPRERNDTLEELLTALRTRVDRAAEAVEGPNEYSYSGEPLWVEQLRAYQRRLYGSVKGDPALAHLPVVAPSLISWQDHDLLGDMRDALDLGNKHSYPGGDLPEANLTEELRVAAMVSGDRPVWVTETGYHNATATTSGHRPASEAAAATYLPRLFLEYFRRGVARTFAYELIDEWPDPARKNLEASFGLLRNDYSEKPAYRRLANLIGALSDPGPAHAAAPLDLTVGEAPSDLRRLVLQKRDGSYHVVLWRAARVWDPVAREPLAAESLPVSLRVGGGFGRAELIDPARSAQPFESRDLAGELRVEVGPDPVIVRLVPAAAEATQAGPAPATPPPAGGDAAEPAGSPVKVSPSRLTISRRGLRRVLRRGLLVRCRAGAARTCRVSAVAGGHVVASGSRALDVSGSGRVRIRPTRRGARLLRRAAARKRPLKLRMRATARLT